MTTLVSGIHHVTAIASDPQQNIDFYTELLGLRLVKRTVNFDDPGTYHLYFGDKLGTPGTILTFFPWPHARRGSPGPGTISTVAFSVPEGSLGYWEQRLRGMGVPVEREGARLDEEVLSSADLDGMRIEIVAHAGTAEPSNVQASSVPEEHRIRGFHSVTLAEEGYEKTADVLGTLGYNKISETGNRFRFEIGNNSTASIVDVLCMPAGKHPMLGAGSVHHVAFRTPDDSSQLEWRETLAGKGHNVTPVLDRNYFHSIYFREPGGVLFEIATDPPGFSVDEAVESLGESLKLPNWLEPKRNLIEKILPPIEYPKALKGSPR